MSKTTKHFAIIEPSQYDVHTLMACKKCQRGVRPSYAIAGMCPACAADTIEELESAIEVWKEREELADNDWIALSDELGLKHPNDTNGDVLRAVRALKKRLVELSVGASIPGHTGQLQ